VISSTLKEIVVFFLLLCLSFPAVRPVLAQGDIVVLVNEHRYQFAQEIGFSLETTGSNGITDVVLSYQVSGRAKPFTVRPDFVAGPHVSVQYVHDLRRHYIRPFTEITYRWAITDAAGQQLTTEAVTFAYDDDRFSWHSPLTEADITVTWYRGTEAFGRKVLAVARQARERISAEIGVEGGMKVERSQPIRIYLYAHLDDLHGALNPGGREWVAGQAFPGLSTFLVAISPDQDSVTEMQRIIPHEISHLVVHQAAPDYVPPWLDEGLAVLNEELPAPQREAALKAALTQDGLLPLETLCAPFPLDSHQATLAYAQSASVVRFVREQYGREGLSRLVAAYGLGATCQRGVEQALGVTLKQLEDDWRADLPMPNKWLTFLENNGAWIGLWGGSCLMALLFLQTVPLLFWRRRREKKEEEREEEVLGRRSEWG
jgi:hypothetical protein